MPFKSQAKNTAQDHRVTTAENITQKQSKLLYISSNFFNYANYKQQLLLIIASLTGVGLSYWFYNTGQVNNAMSIVSNGYNYLTNLSSMSLPLLSAYSFFKAAQPDLHRYNHPENEELKTNLITLDNWGPAFADVNPSYLMKHDSPKLPAWRRSIQYGYFLDLRKEHGETNLRQKIKLIENAVKSLKLLPIQQEVLSHTKIFLVAREILSGDYAITEPTDGSIMLAVDVPEKTYEYYLKNELSHAVIRYVNLMHYGKEKLPKDMIRVCLPYVNADWSINVEKRQQFIKALEDGFARIMHLRDVYRENPENAELMECRQQLTNFRPEYIDALSANVRLALGDSVNDHVLLFVTYMKSIMHMAPTYREMGGLNYQIIEEISDIQSVLDWELQSYFFPELTELLDEFYDLRPIPSSNFYNLRAF